MIAATLLATALLTQTPAAEKNRAPESSSPPLIVENVKPHVGAGHYGAYTSGSLGYSGGGALFNLNVGGGYFVSDDLLVGGNFGLSAGGGSFNLNLSLDASYWARLQPRIFLVPGARVALSPYFGAANGVSFDLGVSVALAVFLTDWLDIEPTLNVGLALPTVAPNFTLSWGMRWFF